MKSKINRHGKLTRAQTGAILLIILASTLSGCATYSVNKTDGSVTTAGFFRNLKVVNEYYENGALKRNEIVSESTTRDIMSGTNELIDTAANTYSKIKP
jgi:hypothetical protein